MNIVTTMKHDLLRWRVLGSALVALLTVLAFQVGSGKTEPAPLFAASQESAILSATVPYTNCRFGVGEVNASITVYEDFSDLHLGWYLDWTAPVNPPQPLGIEFAPMIHIRSENGVVSYSPSGASLAAVIADKPGAMWLIGNEPDSPVQNNLLPEEYAKGYHDAYIAVKTLDPTAHIVAGNIVQPTPLRMQYLDEVLEAYWQLYGEGMPVGAWGVHSFILREADCEHYPDSCWGALIPPGLDAPHGDLYEVEDMDDLDIFRQRILDFRHWMADHGYRNVPLYVTEYGLLMPHNYEGWGPERTKVFMYGSFDFFLTASDPQYGYPLDGNRLVQRWLWWSMDDPYLGGPLFDVNTRELLPSGEHFAAYTSGLSPTIDLLAVSAGLATPPPLYMGEAVTVTLRARISNVGNQPLNSPITVRFFDDKGNLIAERAVDTYLAGCADFIDVEVDYPNLDAGVYPVRVVVDPENTLVELDESNNEVEGKALVATFNTWLPLLMRR